MAIQPVQKQGIAFFLREQELFAAHLLHINVQIRHQDATCHRHVHRFGNAVLGQFEFVVCMGERIGVIPMEFTTQVKGGGLAQVQIQNRIRGIRAGHGNLVTLGAQFFHAQHALLVKVQAHPLVATFQNGLVHAIGVVFFDNVDILQAEHFGRTDHGRNIVRVEQIFEHHAKMSRTAVHHRRQKFTTAFRHAFQKGFQSFVRHFFSLIT